MSARTSASAEAGVARSYGAVAVAVKEVGTQ